MFLVFLAAAGGEPHIMTLDGLWYTFNGLGEYWMIKSSAASLKVQVGFISQFIIQNII